MDTSSVTVKGQIVIPSKIRRRHNIKQGTRVYFLEQDGDIILRPLTNEYIDSLKGAIGSGGRALTTLLEEKERERAR